MTALQAARIITQIAIYDERISAGRFCTLVSILSQVKQCLNCNEGEYNQVRVDIGRATKKLARRIVDYDVILTSIVDSYIREIISILGRYTRLYILD